LELSSGRSHCRSLIIRNKNPCYPPPRECDTVRQYVDACLVPLTPSQKADTKIAWQKGDTTYADYKAWVRDNGHGQPLTSIRFLKRLRAHLCMAKGEGHKNDGNYYPVRMREFAQMRRNRMKS